MSFDRTIQAAEGSVDLSLWGPGYDEDGAIRLEVENIGPGEEGDSVRYPWVSITPTQARELAQALIAVADHVESGAS